MIEEHRFTDAGTLADALAESVAGTLEEALSQRSRASLVVSGGSTPRPFFERLRERPLPWERIDVTLADERWVPTDHPESNERFVRETLLRSRAERASWTGLKTAAAEPEAACAGLEEALARLRPFSVVVLGMGADGHTASLFPGDPGLDAALALEGGSSCFGVAPVGDRRPRISLTLAALVDSGRIVLHFTGREKWRTYEQARQPGPDAELPVRALLRSAPRGVDVFWAP